MEQEANAWIGGMERMETTPGNKACEIILKLNSTSIDYRNI